MNKTDDQKTYEKALYYIKIGDRPQGIIYLDDAASEGNIKAMCDMVLIAFEDGFNISVLPIGSFAIDKDRKNINKASAILSMIKLKRDNAEDDSDVSNIDTICSNLLVDWADRNVFCRFNYGAYLEWLKHALISFKILSFFADIYDGPVQVTAKASLTRWKESGGGPHSEYNRNNSIDYKSKYKSKGCGYGFYTIQEYIIHDYSEHRFDKYNNYYFNG